MNGDVTAMDINCALASRYRRDGDGYWSEISVTEPNDTVLRLDGVALEVNWLFCFNVCSTGSAVFFRSVG